MLWKNCLDTKIPLYQLEAQAQECLDNIADGLEEAGWGPAAGAIVDNRVLRAGRIPILLVRAGP
jgi:hypothetical protein